MQKEFLVSRPEETIAIARRLGELIEPPAVLFLKGEMGTGKTQFAKAFTSGSGSTDDTSSPTFTIVNTYTSPKGPIHHFDLYRLSDIDEFYAAGLEDSIDSHSVSLIEWPELLQDELEPDMIITISATGESSRRIILETEDEDLIQKLNEAH